MRPCSHSNRTYGSIFEEELGAIYARMTEWRTGELLPTKCLDCAHLARCSGGCRCEAEYAGDIRGADPYASRPDEVLPLPVRTRPDNEITLAAKVHVDNRVRFRDEDFGCVLWRGHSVAMVGKEAGFLLHALQESPMSLAEAERLSGSNTRDICSVLNGLLPKKMVRIT